MLVLLFLLTHTIAFHLAMPPHTQTIQQSNKTESVYVAEDSSTLYILDRYGGVFTATLPSSNTSTTESEPELHKIGWVGPGRPLGYHLHPHTRTLFICDSLKGLIEFDPVKGTLKILSNAVNQRPIAYANDLDISPTTGIVYFSDSTAIPPALGRGGFYDTMASYVLSELQGGGTGRILSYDPRTGDTKEVVTGLYYANGVALSQDETYLVVAETSSRRLQKVWLLGDKAGTMEVLVHGLPGYPDGVARASKDANGDGELSSTSTSFWVALIAPEAPLMNGVARGGKVGRWVASWALQVLPPPILRKFGMVLKVSGEDGSVWGVLQDRDGSVVAGVSGIMESKNRLYMGHLSGDYVSFVDL